MGAIWVIVIIGVVLILISAVLNDSQRNDERKLHDSSVQQNFIRLNDIRTSADFSCTITNGAFENRTRFIVDDIHEMIYILETGGRSTAMPYSEVNGCEIIVDSQVTGGVKRAVVGGILAGDTGAIVGATTAKQFIMSYKIVIYRNNISSPSTSFVLINQKTALTNQNYKNAVSFAERVNATIKAIMNKPATSARKVEAVSDPRCKKLILDFDNKDKELAVVMVSLKFSMGRDEAKDYVEKGVVCDRVTVEAAQHLAEDLAASGIPTKIVDSDTTDSLPVSESRKKVLIDPSDKVNVIRAMRIKHGFGLAEAKEYVERIIENGAALSEGITAEEAGCIQREYATLGVQTTIVDCD